MAFRFVHAADIHLDSPLRSLALRDPELAELIGNATRRAFAAIVDLCLAEGVDALLLAGDLYDGDQTSMKTARFLAEQLRKLDDAGIHTFIIRGNHDALSKITKELVPPEAVKVFTGRAEAFPVARERGALPIVIHGVSFAQPHAPDSLLPKYRPPTEGAVNIGLMHTSLGGAPGHDPYAPVELSALQAAGFRYWALGHVHRLDAHHGGHATVVMPGMPQGRDVGEAGPKTVTLVTIADDGAIAIEHRHTSIAQFERVTVDVSGAASWLDVRNRVGAALGTARGAAPSEHLVARLRLTGATPLNWQLRRDTDLLRTEAEDQAAQLGRTSIDKVELDTGPTAVAVVGTDPAPVEELGRLMAGLTTDEAFLRDAAVIVEELRAMLPAESRAMLGSDAATLAATVEQAARDGIADVLARLHGQGGG